MALNRETLLIFLQKDLGVDVSNVEDASPLFSSGIIDSFSLVSLITFVERQCGFRMGPEDVNLENLDSVERILVFATRTQQVSSE